MGGKLINRMGGKGKASPSLLPRRGTVFFEGKDQRGGKTLQEEKGIIVESKLVHHSVRGMGAAALPSKKNLSSKKQKFVGTGQLNGIGNFLSEGSGPNCSGERDSRHSIANKGRRRAQVPG